MSKYPVSSQEVDISAVRAQGAGGQNVNKVSSAIHLRFVIRDSALPEHIKERLLALQDQRLSKDGVLIIKAQQYRTQEQNRQDALQRLQQLVDSVSHEQKARRASKPSYGARQRRMDSKSLRGKVKSLRGPVRD
ncbi:alternative ribosome rescue aminoacyl-tRNA hydrolase ArfB [Vogesella sp. AC12]|uniref:alternative ribosome rescue aminoacyl-tRNA hydrolase ArfB n=1 Tax=Vogesella sp. AC12 TaxID=2950550 RepID=UPI00210BFFC3|nr:alternative ribosome rescue aminoacyl-tRNA hydrolase ArfB [Vogesella sp. AC12]MCQ4143507.1 aminoacyl-tRNA hydrolase [Vogesella sp. AC12]